MSVENSPAALPSAFGPPPASGVLRQTPEDFQVEEDLGYTPEGEGEHLWLWVEKRRVNTDQVARQLAKLAGVRQMDVGYAGLKDRHAVTRQWYSIHVPKDAMEQAAQWHDPQWRILQQARARRKIRRGSLHGNRFIITLREVCGDKQAIESRLREITARGVPNYFGEQRFGRDNIARAEAMARGELRVADRNLRGIYLSSLRSALFNAVLARRVNDDSWDRALDGEAFNLNGSRSFFVADVIDAVILHRLATGDIHPSGPLWGRGESPSRGEAQMLELAAIAACPALWCQACSDAGMEQERRPLRLAVQGLQWQWNDDALLRLEFGLPAGAYATTLIRELVDTRGL
jgi:tRNA pseudouridine13 synthase